MALSDHPEVAAGGDPVSALLDDTLVTRIRTATSVPARGDVSESTTPFLMTDTRRVTDVIGDTIADIQASGDWNEDVAQRGRVIRGFAWITGNKRLCDYGPGDARLFAATLRKLPTEFRWGTFEKGNMSRPFDEVMAEVEKKGGTRRDDRTVPGQVEVPSIRLQDHAHLKKLGTQRLATGRSRVAYHRAGKLVIP